MTVGLNSGLKTVPPPLTGRLSVPKGPKMRGTAKYLGIVGLLQIKAMEAKMTKKGAAGLRRRLTRTATRTADLHQVNDAGSFLILTKGRPRTRLTRTIRGPPAPKPQVARPQRPSMPMNIAAVVEPAVGVVNVNSIEP